MEVAVGALKVRFGATNQMRTFLGLSEAYRGCECLAEQTVESQSSTRWCCLITLSLRLIDGLTPPQGALDAGDHQKCYFDFLGDIYWSIGVRPGANGQTRRLRLKQTSHE